MRYAIPHSSDTELSGLGTFWASRLQSPHAGTRYPV